MRFPTEAILLSLFLSLCEQITEATISNTCGRLVAISVPRQNNNHEWMKGPVEVHMWDLNNHTDWKIQLSLYSSISRQLKVGCGYLVTFVQCRRNVSATDRSIAKSGMQNRRKSTSNTYFADEAVVQVIDKHGSTLQTFQIPGKFSGVSVVNREPTLRSISEGLLVYNLQEGVVKAQNVKSNKVVGTFTVNNAEITTVNIASNGKSAVVGCGNGNVHIIQMI
ncbi:hypothetical protein OS493_035421 [Desmophyllum pertusum]|uniref:Uncharacterized protein n=1 Tax=Desmophyllum pertusum TaxID=174260 RepID=A0A9X0D0L9_9CNID|nr:hypothetical protein OS493_035421 [Desmophyllum pertusum]